MMNGRNEWDLTEKGRWGGVRKVTTPEGMKGEEERRCEKRSCDEKIRRSVRVWWKEMKEEEEWRPWWMERTKTTPRWENLKGLEVDTFAREMINGRRRTEEDGRKRRGGGWSGEDSLAYAGLVHWAFPALPFYLPLFSLLLFSRNIWVGGRESNRVCEEEGESYSKWSDDRVRGREWQRK